MAPNPWRPKPKPKPISPSQVRLACLNSRTFVANHAYCSRNKDNNQTICRTALTGRPEGAGSHSVIYFIDRCGHALCAKIIAQFKMQMVFRGKRQEGIIFKGISFMSRNYSTWSRMLETNLTGTLRACQIFGCSYPGGDRTSNIPAGFDLSRQRAAEPRDRRPLQQNARGSEMLTDRDDDEKCF